MKALDVQTRVSVKNVLYATDFSPVAEFAAPIAAELARKFGAKLLAVHVRPPQVYGLAPPESWPAIQEAADRQSGEQKKHLEELFRGVENSVRIGEGDTWEVISALISEKEIDLVVIGTRGRRNLEKVLLGSVAEKILRHSPVPVVMGVKRTEGDLGASTHMPWAIAHKVISLARCPVLTVLG